MRSATRREPTGQETPERAIHAATICAIAATASTANPACQLFSPAASTAASANAAADKALRQLAAIRTTASLDLQAHRPYPAARMPSTTSVGSGSASAHATVSAALTSAAPAGARLSPSAAHTVSASVTASSPPTTAR